MIFTIVDEIWVVGTYIAFKERVDLQKPKTKVWDVVASDGFVLGQIKWFAKWRGYAFFPVSATVFEKTCLREIADFITYTNKTQRSIKKVA